MEDTAIIYDHSTQTVLRRALEPGLAAGVAVMNQRPGSGRAILPAALPQRHPHGVIIKSLALVVAACQATIRWANTSTMKAT
jgi:hypothetical protein